MTRTTLILSGILLTLIGVIYSIPCWLIYWGIPTIIPDPFTIVTPIPIIVLVPTIHVDVYRIPLFQDILIIVGLLILIEGRIN